MNLLSDNFNWIPVIHQGRFRHISLKDLLCKDEDWQISLNRDDMELAALQLVVCLVQVVFMPRDGKELKRRMETPLTEEEVEKACPSCAAIALFQQATNGVSLGGSPFPVGLKGMSPVTTLVFYQNLRKRIWGNILRKEFLSKKKLYSANPADNKPTWK